MATIPLGSGGDDGPFFQVSFFSLISTTTSDMIDVLCVQVFLHDDSEHTLEYAIEALEKSFVSSIGRLPGLLEPSAHAIDSPALMRARRRLQWTAFQTHHYGMGLVSVLGEGEARVVVQNLKAEGLRSSMVPF